MKKQSDKEKFIAMLRDFGIGHEDEDGIVTCKEGMKKVKGYNYFYAIFKFDEKGKFVEMGVYE
jgi:hypothetical protein